MTISKKYGTALKDLQHFRKYDEDIVAKGESVEFLESPFDCEGKQRYLRTTKIPYTAADGRKLLLGVVVDLTRETESRNELEKLKTQLEDTLAQHEFLLENMPVLVYAKDADNDFRYVYCNGLCSELFGCSQPELIGKNTTELLGNAKDIQAFRSADEEVLADDKLHESIMPFTGADGQRRIGHFYRKRLRLSGNRTWIFGIVADITESETLAANQKILSECLKIFFQADNIPKAIEQVLENIATHMGASHCYLLRFNSHEDFYETTTVAEYTASGFLPLLKNQENFPCNKNEYIIETLLNREDVVLHDLQQPEQLAKAGSWQELCHIRSINAAYIAGIWVNGELWGDIGLLYEEENILEHPQFSEIDLQFLRAAAHLIELLQERRQNADRLQHALERACAADKAKSMFLASMSHEIRTPLNAVIGFSELLLDATLPENERKEYLTGISSAGNALLALINDVLDLSKLEAGQMVFAFVLVDFAEMLSEVCSVFKQKCAQRQIYLKTEIANNLPDVWIDKLRVRQILFNLIGNAVKFTEEGGITVKVGFEPESATVGTLSFHVIDTGCGIAPEEQKQLFQMFVQASSSSKSGIQQEGTGLGLAICHRLIEQMNGTVNLDSTPGRGATFSVELRDIRYEIHKAFAPKSTTVDSVGSVRTLLVDDVLLNLKVLSAMMKKITLQPLIATSAKEALDILDRESIELVLTDLWMPEMNGMELAQKIRGSGRFSGIKIVAVTADTDSGENFDMSIFDAVLTKPVTTAKLIEIITGYSDNMEHQNEL